MRRIIERFFVSALIGVLIGAAVSLYIITYNDNSDRISEISHSRYLDCKEQNARHISTVDYLDHLAAVESKNASESKRQEIRKGLREYVLLINALAPEKVCHGA